MLGRKNRAETVKDALLTVASYADGALHNPSLHHDIRSALDHGAVAVKRVRKDAGRSNLLLRLNEDKRLRKNLKALIDDLESANERIRGTKRHRLRNALLLAGAGSLVVAIPDVRKWLAMRVRISRGGDTIATAT